MGAISSKMPTLRTQRPAPILVDSLTCRMRGMRWIDLIGLVLAFVIIFWGCIQSQGQDTRSYSTPAGGTADAMLQRKSGQPTVTLTNP